jgi:tryptophan 2,3-dioxygenase
MSDALRTETERLGKQVRELRAQVETETQNLKRIIAQKEKVEENDGLDKKEDNPELGKQKHLKLSNDLREVQLKLSNINSELKTSSERRKRITDDNSELERINKVLVNTNEKLRSIKTELSDDVKQIQSKLDSATNASEGKIALRLSEIERLAGDHRKALEDIDKDRAALKDEINSHIRQKKDLEADQEKILSLQVDLKVKIDAAEKDHARAKQLQVSWTNKIADLKNEENRVEILRLRVLKMINDNKSIKELAELRKELLK